MDKEFVIKASRGEFKGNAMIVLSSGDNDKYPFQFGLVKAKRIVACLEEIKAFVTEQEAKASQPQEAAK